MRPQIVRLNKPVLPSLTSHLRLRSFLDPPLLLREGAGWPWRASDPNADKNRQLCLSEGQSADCRDGSTVWAARGGLTVNRPALDLGWKHRLGCITVYILWIEITCLVKPVHANGCRMGREWVRREERSRERKNGWAKPRRQRVSQGNRSFNESRDGWGWDQKLHPYMLLLDFDLLKITSETQQILVLAIWARVWMHVWGYFSPHLLQEKK